VVLGDAGDHLLDEHRLADASATEKSDLSTLDVRGEQVDDLDAGLEHDRLGLELVEGGGRTVDAPALADLELLVTLEVEALAGGVEDVAERDVTNGHRDRPAGVFHRRAADHTVGGLQRDGAHHVVADVLGDLEVQALRLAGQLDLDGQQVVHRRHGIGGELHVDDRADDAGDTTDSALGRGVRGSVCGSGSHVLSQPSYLADARASTPPTISLISWVISA
jgi:hypothetical protein